MSGESTERIGEPVETCFECGESIEEDEQLGCVDCGEVWSGEDERNCPSCGRFGHRCAP